MIHFNFWRLPSDGVCSKNAIRRTHNAGFCVLYDQSNNAAPNNLMKDKKVWLFCMERSKKKSKKKKNKEGKKLKNQKKKKKM